MAMDIVKQTKKRVETSKKKLAKTIDLKSYRKLAVNFLILTVNLIIIILYFSLSQATVVIVPAKEDFSHAVDIAIAENPNAPDAGLAIAGSATNADVSHTQEFSVDPTVSEPAQAEGMITIYNSTSDRNQTFVANTRFQNEAGLEIKIKKQVQVAPGAQVAVAAFASEPGKGGEAGADSGRFQVVKLPYLKDKIYAEVTAPFTGGTKPVRSLTQAAFNAAKAQVEAALREKGFDLLSATNASKPDKNALSLEVADLTTTANPGDANVESFTITAKGAVSAFRYDEARALEIVKQELIKQIPPDKILLAFNDDSFSVALNAGGSSVTASITAALQPKIPETALNQEDIIGLNQEEVRVHFTKITGIRDVQIEFWPFWVRSVPNLKDHVNIEIKR
ncbi:MAG: hypothetical protein HYS45_01760 [Parcubacteria group bacterium]|nr:hypothetical protein [Parcubacteria group bacterium]MBI2637241.1 hypothetical protein [Parcubacteria group bacterium]